jgi:hypothetical protein
MRTGFVSVFEFYLVCPFISYLTTLHQLQRLSSGQLYKTTVDTQNAWKVKCKQILIIYPIDRMCHPSVGHTVNEFPTHHHPLCPIDNYKEGRELSTGITESISAAFHYYWLI